MSIPDKTRFSDHLHGKDGLESVYELMLAEVKLLEKMEAYTEKRAMLDYEYAEKLAKLHERIKIDESDSYIDGSQIEKVRDFSFIFLCKKNFKYGGCNNGLLTVHQWLHTQVFKINFASRKIKHFCFFTPSLFIVV